jgi:prepilin-type processing-associated H-X9-DG protein
LLVHLKSNSTARWNFSFHPDLLLHVSSCHTVWIKFPVREEAGESHSRRAANMCQWDGHCVSPLSFFWMLMTLFVSLRQQGNSVTVMVNFMGLGSPDIWQNIVLSVPECFLEMGLTFKSVDWVKQMALHSVGRPF